MSKWIRGRLARPIASIASVMMLVSLLLPLAIPPVQAQSIDLSKFFGNDLVKPTPIIVVDFDNRSSYKSGMLGRTLSDALSIELLNVKPPFDVIKRSEVEKQMSDMGLVSPLTGAELAMLASRLHCAFSVSGTVKSVEIHHEREGTYAEVDIEAVVNSKVTQGPINGAHVIQRSSPKIGYSGNTDVLVHEALSTAAYQIVLRLLDNRVPVATVLTSPEGYQVVLKGGTTIGFRKGQMLTTMRRESVTGRVRLIDVTPTESIGEILEDSKGIAPGDKAVPIFEFTSSARFTKADRAKTGLQLAGLGLLGVLATLIGTDNGNKVLQAGTVNVSAFAMADAATMGEQSGATLVTWPHSNARVVAYIIYRDTNSMAPLAVVDGTQTHYIDSGQPLPHQGDVAATDTISITLDPTTGLIQTFTHAITYETTLDDINTPTETMSKASYAVTAHRVPLQPGDVCGYQVKMLYYDYDNGDITQTSLQHPQQYALYLGNRSPLSGRITMTQPPTLSSPANGVLPDGNFRCTRVTGAMNYFLELSTSPNFPKPIDTPTTIGVNTTTIGIPAVIDSEKYALGVQLLTGLPNFWFGKTLYWRMGANVTGQPAPYALSDHNQDGWVFSSTDYFLFNSFPPPPPSMKTRGTGPSVGKLRPSGRGSGRLFQR